MSDLATSTGALRRLATLHGIELSYRDVDDRLVEASPEALLGTLRALGVDVERPDDAEEAVRARRAALVSRRLPPVTAATDDGPVVVELRLPDRALGQPAECELELESGDRSRWVEPTADRQPLRVDRLGEDRYPVVAITLSGVPTGYHRLRVGVDGHTAETLLVVAPVQAYSSARRAWGAFLPLYALRTARAGGVGDLTDLEALGRWVGELGGAIVGTLPLLPVYLEGERFDASPYSPVSRLFWNELHLDLTRSPEWRDTDRPPVVPDGDLVDWRVVAEARGRALRAMSDRFFADPGGRRGDLERSIEERPELEDYALFRGAVARYGSAWWDWPPPLRDGRLTLDDVDLGTARHHLYAQMLCREQVAALSARLRAAGMEPYLDLPIGTVGDGYDVWRHRSVFAHDADAGAPPDTIFRGGQNWSFPPLHPERLRESEYRYVVAVLRHHLELADHLRVDHVMGLHRLYWIPQGFGATEGVYVRYPADELYAIVSLESHRHRSTVVGEDLGTVPDEVRDALRARGVRRMFVVQYETRPHEYDVLPPVPGDTVASVNTHDVPPFAAFWRDRDVDDQVDLGLLDEDGARRSREDRGTVRWKVTSLLTAQGRLSPEDADDPVAVHAALLEWLGASDAPVVLANLEDLWGEERPQNTPGTTTERANWRRRARYALEDLRERPWVVEALRRLDAARSPGGGRHG